MTSRLREVALLFLKLGTIGFGGPAVHFAAMEQECVERRKWLTHEQFVDLIGATNLIPGPNSTEMAMHVGYVRAGIVGLIVAGCCFIFPAVTITTAFAWTYVTYGQGPNFEPVMDGIKPVVLAIIATAGWRLGQKVIKRYAALVLAVAAIGASLYGFREIPILGVGAALGMILLWRKRSSSEKGPPKESSSACWAPLVLGMGSSWLHLTRGLGATSLLAATSAKGVTLAKLGLFFLKVGAVLYGTGYVLIAYLEGELVTRTEWLTADQLDSAIAIGQFTPGPILSTATFIG